MSDQRETFLLVIDCPTRKFACRRRFVRSALSIGEFRSFLTQLLNIPEENLVVRVGSTQIDADRDDFQLENLSDGTRVRVDSMVRLSRAKERSSMSDEVYDRRRGTLREFLRKNKIGKFDDRLDSAQRRFVEEKIEFRRSNKMKLKQIEIDQRVEIIEPKTELRTGRVAYIGSLRDIHDVFIGVIFDETCGDSDGSFRQIRYFDAVKNSAAFIRPEFVRILMTK